MKKLTTLFLASALVMAVSAPAHAVDVKADGVYLFQFQSGSTDFAGTNEDYAQQRVRLGLTFAANEDLSGYFQTESIWEWGTNDTEFSNGTAFDGAKVDVAMRQAYVDWVVPNTVVKIRMGRHGFDMPAYASVSPIIADGEAIGAVLLLSKEQGARMGDAEMKVAETAAGIVGRQMEQ